MAIKTIVILPSGSPLKGHKAEAEGAGTHPVRVRHACDAAPRGVEVHLEGRGVSG
jgi:hypothetical protein